MSTNRTARLAARPQGMVTQNIFAFADEPVPEPGDGEFLVKLEMYSIDPAMRGWINEGRSYVPPVGIGEVMRAIAGGIVVKSNHPGFAEGDAVTGLLGIQTYAVSDGQGISKVDLDAASMDQWLGGLGMPGLTAYFGLLEVGQPKEGDT
ncbi:MAG: NADP-dependent oxidoreductase, partial [Pseudomonadota bacterium]